MSIQVAYVLTSSGKDVYAHMNLISLRSLRYSNSNVKINLVCDTETVQSLDACNHPILEEADKIISVKTPDQPPSSRNRFVKTSLRKYLSGDFLYLDGDTLIRDYISEIFSTEASLAGVPNHNGTGSYLEIPATETLVYERFNWSLPACYANGGVLFFADTPETYSFCDLWHQKWLECSLKTGKHFDQPSLNSAINDSKVNFAWLDHRFNAQVHARPHTAWNASIWHIYLSEPHVSPRNVLGQALEKAQKQGLQKIVNSNEITKFCQKSHPWLVNNPLDLVAIFFLKRDKGILNTYRWERLWLADRYDLIFGLLYSRLRMFIRPRHRFASLKSKVFGS